MLIKLITLCRKKMSKTSILHTDNNFMMIRNTERFESAENAGSHLQVHLAKDVHTFLHFLGVSSSV